MPMLVGQDTSKAKDISCGGCGGVNRYYPNEVKLLWSGTDYSGGADGAKGINCVQCGKQIITERW